MSAQQLADETERLHYPISRSQIANYESRRKRGLDVTELLVLAAALNTSPAALLYPGPYDKEVEALPGTDSTEFHAVQWFSGLSHGFTDIVREPGGAGASGASAARLRTEYRQNTQLLRLWRQLEEWQVRKASIVTPKGGSMTREQREQIAFYDSQIEQLREQIEHMREDDGVGHDA